MNLWHEIGADGLFTYFRPGPGLRLQALLLVLLPALLGGCSCWSRWVDFKVHRLLSARVNSIDDTGFTMQVRTEVENPNVVSASLTRIRFRTYMGKRMVGKGRVKGTVKAPARRRFVLESPVRIAYADLPADLPARVAKGKFKLRIATRLTAKTSLGTFPLKLVSRGQVRVDESLKVAIKGPFKSGSTKVESIVLSEVGLFGSRLVVRLSAHNAFAFPLSVRRASFSIAVSGAHFGTGTLDRPVKLAPRTRTVVEVEVEASHGAMGQTLMVMLTSDPTFRITGTLWIDPIAGVTELPVDVTTDSSILKRL